MLMKGFPDMQSKGRKQTKMETLLLQVCIVLVTALPRANSDNCTKMSACSCIYSDGSTVDLSPLDSGGGTAKFQDVPDTQGIDMFSWNPCTPFSEGSCINMAVCQKRPFIPKPEYYSLGDQNSATFTNDNMGKLTLSYNAVQMGVSRLTFNGGETFHIEASISLTLATLVSSTSGLSRYILPDSRNTSVQYNMFETSIVTLTCNQFFDWELDVQGEKESTKYYMELKSKYACPKGAPTVTPTPHHDGGDGKKGGLSIGSILCIVFFCLLAVYLAGGIAFQIFVRKESGRRVIPNISFWSKIPGFTKDGVLFVVQKGRGSNYAKI